MNIKKFFILILPLIISGVIFTSCGDNSVSSNSTNNNPDIIYKPGATYIYNNDTISQNGINYGLTLLTTDTIQAYDTNYQGKPCYPVFSTTKDTITHITIKSNTYYYSYNKSDGKFYQYGAKKFFDSTQVATWDLVADFTQPVGTEISLFTMNNLLGNSNLSANVKSKIAIDTVIVTTLSNVTVNCYRISLRAEVYLGGSLSLGNTYLDYYIGYTPASNSTNPNGRVRTKLYPINLNGLTYPGGDQILRSFTLPTP